KDNKDKRSPHRGNHSHHHKSHDHNHHGHNSHGRNHGRKTHGRNHGHNGRGRNSGLPLPGGTPRFSPQPYSTEPGQPTTGLPWRSQPHKQRRAHRSRRVPSHFSSSSWSWLVLFVCAPFRVPAGRSTPRLVSLKYMRK